MRDRIMSLHQLARLLGFAGLVPFIAFSAGAWTTLPIMQNAHFVLMTYAAIILSFMGAVHWGLAMSGNGTTAKIQLGASVLPALLGWLALLIPMLYGYMLLAACFIVLLMADKLAGTRSLVPDWYLPMRYILTTVVVLCLVVAALTVFVL